LPFYILDARRKTRTRKRRRKENADGKGQGQEKDKTRRRRTVVELRDCPISSPQWELFARPYVKRMSEGF